MILRAVQDAWQLDAMQAPQGNADNPQGHYRQRLTMRSRLTVCHKRDNYPSDPSANVRIVDSQFGHKVASLCAIPDGGVRPKDGVLPNCGTVNDVGALPDDGALPNDGILPDGDPSPDVGTIPDVGVVPDGGF